MLLNPHLGSDDSFHVGSRIYLGNQTQTSGASGKIETAEVTHVGIRCIQTGRQPGLVTECCLCSPPLFYTCLGTCVCACTWTSAVNIMNQSSNIKATSVNQMQSVIIGIILLAGLTGQLALRVPSSASGELQVGFHSYSELTQVLGI